MALPLLNSSSPWATTQSDLRGLYESEYTSAVTTRTSLLHGFAHDDNVHKMCFFAAGSHSVPSTTKETLGTDSSLNTYGYSPFPLADYLQMISTLYAEHDEKTPGKRKKPFIVSVTGVPSEIVSCYGLIVDLAKGVQTVEEEEKGTLLSMEINLSCPNIANKPPPAYDSSSLSEYLIALKPVFEPLVKIGVKVPPYTYMAQFQMLLSALEASAPGGPIAFITSTNTLGSSIVFTPSITSSSSKSLSPALPSEDGSGIGGMAGSALHPLALGNVYRIRQLLDGSKEEEVRRIEIVGVGGVGDREGYERMRAAGANRVALATALGREGVGVFEKITKGKEL
ncbi:FMN-linked oxidoreductase [Atractiella rhizophila]|nr:FMN-linked oxidoreductase [Atractiella rhizophila]